MALLLPGRTGLANNMLKLKHSRSMHSLDICRSSWTKGGYGRYRASPDYDLKSRWLQRDVEQVIDERALPAFM